MKNLIRILSLLLLTLSFSCEKQGLLVKCDECTVDEPNQADLKIKLDYYSGATVINFYIGNIEDSVLYKTLQTSSTDISVSVILNKKYTVTALYYIPDNYYIAVDSAIPRVSYSKDQCTDPCYFVYDRTIDLRLKYTR
jgi:hypothetical protein